MVSKQAELSLPPKPANDVLRDRLDEIRHELAADDLEPARMAALQLEADKLNKLLRVCFQDGGGE